MYTRLLPFEDQPVARGLAPWLAVVCVLSGCVPEGPGPAPAVALRVEAVVYGGDDRLDYFAHPDANLRAIAASSSVALIDGWLLHATPDGELRLPDETFGELYDLCEGERFAEQPSVAHCSGTLVADDLVLTSGHCLDVVPCERLALAFGYLYASEGELATLTQGDVYGCSEVVARRETDGTGRDVDHAWVRLDRPAAPHLVPARLHLLDGPLRRGEPLSVIGFSAGLPVKIDSGGEVVDGRDGMLDYFRATSDTFHGSSGSGVFDSQGQLRGVLARGADDYIRVHNDCNSVRSQDNDLITEREEATYVARAIDALCDGSDGRGSSAAERTAGLCSAARFPPELADMPSAAACSGLPGRPARRAPIALLAVLLALGVLSRRRLPRARQDPDQVAS